MLIQMLALIQAKVARLLRLQVRVGQELLALAAVALAVGLWMHWKAAPPALSSPNTGLGLQDFVENLKTELEQMESKRRVDGRAAMFRVRDFDLELSFVLKASEKSSGKIEARIVTAEMERELGREQTHKITLHMGMVPPEIVQIAPSSQPLSDEGAVQLPFVPAKK